MNSRNSSHSRAAPALMIAAAIAALIAGAATSLLTRSDNTATSGTATIAQSNTWASVLSTPRPLPELSLVDQTGEPFGTTQLAGRWSLLFFGFTHCPDVCPTTLSDMQRLRKSLRSLPGTEQPNIVFVSVDPTRDTPETLATYLAFFDAAATGLTGTPEAIRQLTDALGVAVAVREAQDGATYSVDHTAALFAVNPNAELAAVFVPPHNLEHMADDWRTIVSAGGR